MLIYVIDLVKSLILQCSLVLKGSTLPGQSGPLSPRSLDHDRILGALVAPSRELALLGHKFDHRLSIQPENRQASLGTSASIQARDDDGPDFGLRGRCPCLGQFSKRDRDKIWPKDLLHSPVILGRAASHWLFSPKMVESQL